ncbi:hypothetical protein H70357_06580 [Paenibacillus sp. FSL H7-0357]|uniref:PAS domain-containing protein n=1 Tax=Paenibacillus sp. FSL H7-0357 TaxID=1536774 RepID=UPI0004F8E973|nr:PAS domain-containing protein [Paenibacillus sp. FSL H7-0357]AIQ16373.1 hypothetical protein H70357_06580 [Paenibacillus sp. FSL H7-0357]
MPFSISISLIRSLNALPHNALVIDSQGIILFTNDSWKEYNNHYGLSPHADWTGADALELFEQSMSTPSQITALKEALHHILRGESLISSSEFILQTAAKGSRRFRVDAFPLIHENPAANQAIILSLQDVGPVVTSQPVQPVRTIQPLRLHQKNPQPLVPICASCKSIRNSSEEWVTIERFLLQQLSLQFTHDICPDCIRELYPKYAAALKW